MLNRASAQILFGCILAVRRVDIQSWYKAATFLHRKYLYVN